MTILRLVLGRGTLLTAVGLGVGIIGAAVVTRVLRGVLYGATDSGTFVAVIAMLATMALAACLVPARRAALVDPAVALRFG
jgi:ABC-type antimicrobial peptide transport system permease subunit